MTLDEGTEYIPLTPRPFAAAVRELPVTEAATAVSDYWRGEMLVKAGDKQQYIHEVVAADSAFLDVFQYPLRYGDKNALREPHTVVLTQALSESLFGRGTDPIGQAMTMGEYGLCKVTGVIDRDRYASHLPFSCIIRGRFRSDDWQSNNTYVYVRLVSPIRRLPGTCPGSTQRRNPGPRVLRLQAIGFMHSGAKCLRKIPGGTLRKAVLFCPGRCHPPGQQPQVRMEGEWRRKVSPLPLFGSPDHPGHGRHQFYQPLGGLCHAAGKGNGSAQGRWAPPDMQLVRRSTAAKPFSVCCWRFFVPLCPGQNFFLSLYQ